MPGLSSFSGFSEPSKACGSDGSMLLKLCFLRACHIPDLILMGMNCGECNDCVAGQKEVFGLCWVFFSLPPPPSPHVPGSIHFVGVNAVKHQNTELFQKLVST